MLQRLPQASGLDQGEVEQGFDLREVLNFVWRQWKFISAVVGVTLLVGVINLARQVPLYTATAQVLLEPRKEMAAGPNAFITDMNLDIQSVDSQIAILRSTIFLRRVVDKENLVTDPEFGRRPSSDPGRGQSLLQRASSYFAGSPAERPAPPPEASGQAIPTDVLATIGSLQGRLTVARGQGYVLLVSITSNDPVRAARIANAIAEAFIVDKLDARFEAARRASNWLSDRVGELRKQVRELEEAVAKFRTEHNLVQSGTNISLNQQQLGELNGRVVAARADTAEKKARLDLLESMERSGRDLQSLPDLVNAPSVMALRGQDANISQREADLVARYGDNHPLVVNVRAQRRDVKRQIVSEIQRLAANVKNEYALANARAELLEQSLREVTGQSGIDNTAAITLRELERTAQVNKSLFDDFLQRAKVTQEQSTFDTREARIITPALVPGSPSFPNKARDMIVALILGLLIGSGGAFAKEKLNAGFTTPRQIEEYLELPLLSAISHLDERELTVDNKTVQIPQYPFVKPLSRYSEAIRSIRSGVQMTDVDNPPKVVQFTSTMPGEGKTTIGLSVAASASSSGLKVLFIDADIRRPSATKFFGMQNELGLVDLLMGQVDPKEIIKYDEMLSIWVLAAGSKSQNPPDLLGSTRMKTLVASSKNTFDLVIIDTPPIGPVSDAGIVSQLADKVVYVVRWASTAREMVKRSLLSLPGHKKIAGIVFNHVVDQQAQKYGKYAYAYYYGGRYYKNYYTE